MTTRADTLREALQKLRGQAQDYCDGELSHDRFTDAIAEASAILSGDDEPREKLPNDLVCDACGCDECQFTAWVTANTGEDPGGDGPTDQCYCPDCEIDYAALITRSEYEAAQAVEKSVELAQAGAA